MLINCVRVPASLLVRNRVQVFKPTNRHWSRSPLIKFAPPVFDSDAGHWCCLSTSCGRASSSDTSKTIIGLRSKTEAEDFVGHLSDEQKVLLFDSLNVDLLRNKGIGEEHPYLSKFGRPSTHPSAEADPRHFSQMAPTWLIQPLPNVEALTGSDLTSEEDAASTVPPSLSDIWGVGLKNALPFVGFGFLDNLIMILAGDYIDITIGTALGISTMAAAALGNTISDVAGIASAWYVEKFAEKFGIREPVLSAFQRASWKIRWATTLGRAIGVIIGCLLGMVPLLFLPSSADKKEKEKEKASATPPVPVD